MKEVEDFESDHRINVTYGSLAKKRCTSLLISTQRDIYNVEGARAARERGALFLLVRFVGSKWIRFVASMLRLRRST